MGDNHNVGGMKMDPGDMIVDMQMTFGFGYKTSPILFGDFKVDSAGKFVGALVFILVLAIITELLSFLIWKMKFGKKASQVTTAQKLLSAVFYLLLRMLNYCQMLVAMTFNFWLILSIAAF